jgi:hypothetical protein
MAELERAYIDKECGCPVEEWLCDSVNLTLHFEADGSMELFADTGEWDAIVPLKATTMEAAREEAFAWVAALPHEGESVHDR